MFEVGSSASNPVTDRWCLAPSNGQVGICFTGTSSIEAGANGEVRSQMTEVLVLGRSFFRGLGRGCEASLTYGPGS